MELKVGDIIKWKNFPDKYKINKIHQQCNHYPIVELENIINNKIYTRHTLEMKELHSGSLLIIKPKRNHLPHWM